ncbi:putative Jas TPL-binding domain-containing protein [Lupinus albus]|uniref:Putative Jas TPL-binding domain-containing protein n=1 Tax=Lupinus albus TaxID=3870 RepID=A0A6A4R084_LUPAL|nr:putative Jas TPL-binding domain-containing protein [Lupinus albus]
MPFHSQAFWMAKSPGCLDDGDMTHDNSSRNESKRAHQWSMDGPEVDLFPNKKQEVEAPNNLLPGIPSSSISSWGDPSSYHTLTGHFTQQLFDLDSATMNFEDRNISSVIIDNKLSTERKDNMDPFGGDSLFGLSTSNTLQYPQLDFNYDGIRKVKVIEVNESDNVVSVHTNNPYVREVSSTLSNGQEYTGGDNSISTCLSYNNGGADIISMDDTYGRMDNNLLSMGQSYNKGNNGLSIHQTYKEICNTISMYQGFSKVDSNVISIAQSYNKDDDNSMSRDHLFSKVENGTISMGHAYCNGGNNMPFISHSYNKGESTIISFGGCDDDTTPSDLFISSYELLMGQAPSNNSEAASVNELVCSNSNLLSSAAQASASANVSNRKGELKTSKKATSNNFPSNVRSLLSTGMLDGVSVKYKAWSQEKELRGVIKGAGYLCSCEMCNFSKVINAYEFERHAGCKTKHPNNHIYFDNGKTIYGVVQELRGTPQNMLFDVIQTITGSPINQKSFCIWKESFMAAALELKRICRKDEVNQLL